MTIGQYLDSSMPALVLACAASSDAILLPQQQPLNAWLAFATRGHHLPLTFQFVTKVAIETQQMIFAHICSVVEPLQESAEKGENQ